MKLTIEAMRLNPVAEAGARQLLAAHPTVIFTSGRRDRAQQAHAMACNCAVERQWVVFTYLRAAPFQTWLDQHPEARTVEQIEAGFRGILEAMSDEEIQPLSRHFGGNAWDVLPLLDQTGTPTADGRAIIECIRALPGLEKFLTKEGGLTRWHAQFQPSAEGAP